MKDKSEQFIVAYLTDGGVFEANNYQELKDKIVDYYSSCDAPDFGGISELAYSDDDIVDFQENGKLEDLIADAKKERSDNDGSDLERDYYENLI